MSEIEAPPGTFGRRLVAERTRLGLSIDEIAARLRLHRKQVLAIENESLPALPAPILRGFVRNYAKEVRLDPAPLVAELNALLGPQAGGQQAVARGRSGSTRGAPSDQGSRRVVLVGVLAALIALAVVGGLTTRSDKLPVENAAEAAKPAVAVPAPTPAPAEANKVEAAAPQLEPVASTAAPATPAAPTATPAAAATTAPLPASETVRLSFRDRSWVEVTQGDGRIVHSQLNEAGTEQRIDAKPPLRVVIGNASAVVLDYKGKAVDLKPATTADNVARITLN
jgi:cytoskeleton protein RodZ